MSSRTLLLFLGMAIISAMNLALRAQDVNAAQSSRTPKVTVTVSVERTDPKTCFVQWAIVNHRDHPILFPRAPAAPPDNPIYTVEIERLDRENGWTTLPGNRELPHSDSDPIRLGPGETYRYSWTFPDDYVLQQPGFTYPKPPHAIPLKTELRVVVTYFEDEGDWQAYLTELKADAAYWGRMEPLLRKWGHQAFSDPFKLPLAKRSGGSSSPAAPLPLV